MNLKFLKQYCGFADIMLSDHTRLSRKEARTFLNTLRSGAYTNKQLPRVGKNLFLVPPRPHATYVITNNGDDTFTVWI